MEIKKHNAIDDELLEAAKKGDQKAYSALMEKYQKSIYHIILKIVRNSEDAEDLTIETFAKAFDKIEQYSPQFAFSTWLYKIASNTCIDFLRKKSIDKISLDEENKTIEDNINFSTENTPETDLIKLQRKDALQEIVQSMSPTFSQVITLRYFKEYSYEEMSEALHIPVTTIKVQLHRAKKNLLEILENKKEKL
ncbi:MAG: sigma-70 family RNA polymerase sigma factor [Chitinophagales bacterium]|nr:sigma-70 family RNA polymerase sigma factor [Bacteroidota bacterium]